MGPEWISIWIAGGALLVSIGAGVLKFGSTDQKIVDMDIRLTKTEQNVEKTTAQLAQIDKNVAVLSAEVTGFRLLVQADTKHNQEKLDRIVAIVEKLESKAA